LDFSTTVLTKIERAFSVAQITMLGVTVVGRTAERME
jgi:hypothetical protein